MRRKIVLWGANEKDEKILVALELLEKENLVNIYTFPESVATEEFFKAMTTQWRDDHDVEFPAGFSKIERKLSISDSLLPDEIKVDRPETITLAQAEWHFVVLSSKLYDLYKGELEEIKDRVESATAHDGGIWDDLKGFWTKVQNQVNERNLFKEHGAALREKTNGLFDKLKDLRKILDNEVSAQSKTFVDDFKKELADVDEKIEKGLGLGPLFEDLKKIQGKINNFKFTKQDRDEVWAKIDEAFKKLKEKRSGGTGSGQGGGNYGLTQVESRYKGLVEAINKMQRSMDYDKKDLEFENKRIEISDGQLESMLRQAKINMINERLNSKNEKMEDMLKTKLDLEGRIEREKKKATRAEKDEKVEEAKEIVKAKIASEIADNSKNLEDKADKISQAASEIASSKKPKSEPKEEVSFLDNLMESVENLVEDVQDTAAAVAAVVSEKLGDAMDQAEIVIDEIKEKVADKVEDMTNKSNAKTEEKEEAPSETEEEVVNIVEDKAEETESIVVDEVNVTETTTDDEVGDKKEETEEPS
jgi:chromosome segregation ATPase